MYVCLQACRLYRGNKVRAHMPTWVCWGVGVWMYGGRDVGNAWM